MTIHNKGFFSLCISLLALIVIFNGCENPGSVGSEYVDSPDLRFDTLNIEQTEILSYNGYSGRLGFIPFGQYDDAIFGEINTTALFKPSRTPSIPDSVEIDRSFILKLQLQIDSLEVYGDTLSSAGFSVHEIESVWRGNALTIDDEIQLGDEVGRFTIGPDQDEVIIDLDDLSDDWIREYRSWYYNEDDDADSTYNFEFGGLAVVSNQENSRISFARSNGSRFLLINGADSDTTDTVRVSFRDYGFTLERGGAVLAPNTFPIHTTLEGMLSVTMPVTGLKEETQTSNIIRADLVFYEAKEQLENSLPANHQRLRLNSLNLDVVETVEPEYEYQFGEVDFSGNRDPDEPVYKINVTNYVNNVLYGSETREELVLGAGSTSGAIRSSLFYGINAGEDVRPKIIITSLVD